ncbi:hypothetical protein ACU4GD_18960 [Cupriavidus basilensis]
MTVFWERGYEGASGCRRWSRRWPGPARIYGAHLRGVRQQGSCYSEKPWRYTKQAKAVSSADRAMQEEASARQAIARLLNDAALTYTKRGRGRTAAWWCPRPAAAHPRTNR